MGADGSQNSSVPPPFLTKTYEMVDDPATDDIVSWSENDSSFVVWSVADFTKDLLPQYFKHNNFSSFVRQLNTYGFHKIDPDRQEFANEGFIKGNKEGLKNIHRRKPTGSHGNPSQKEVLSGCNDPAHVDLQGEIQQLKEDKGSLIKELVKVKQLQQKTEVELESLGQRLQALEERQQRIIMFLCRAVHNPAFTRFIQHNESSAFSKKRRLAEQGTLIGIGESWDKELVRYPSGDTGEVMSEGRISHKLEVASVSEFSLDLVLRQFAISTLNQSEETSPLSHSSGVTLWEMQSTVSEHVTNEDAAGKFAVQSPNEAIECCDFTCPVGELKEEPTRQDVTVLCIDREIEVDQEKSIPALVCRKESIEGTKANDSFWESMLTENPRLLDRDLQELKCEGHGNERWFL